MLLPRGCLGSRLARLGSRPSKRCVSGVPLIGQLRTVRQVVGAHTEHGEKYGPRDLAASWNTLGKLVRQPNEKRELQGALERLQPLAEHTEQALPKFDARPLANTVNGLASLHASGWRASDALWAGGAGHAQHKVRT